MGPCLRAVRRSALHPIHARGDAAGPQHAPMFDTSFDTRPRRIPVAYLEGCLDSSLDLRSGLEMRVLEAAALPPELWRELQRLRASWARPQTAQPVR
ncbi:MAG: hypothetical protein AMXMBFR66_10880 [Pseudomonadota bacterium]